MDTFLYEYDLPKLKDIRGYKTPKHLYNKQ
jgi:hypothetical protein